MIAEGEEKMKTVLIKLLRLYPYSGRQLYTHQCSTQWQHEVNSLGLEGKKNQLPDTK